MADDAPPPPPATVQRGGRGRGRGGKGGRARGRGGKGRGRGKGRRDDDAPSDGDDEVKEAEPGDRGRSGKGKGRAKTFGRGAGAPVAAEPAAPAELPYGGDIQAAMRAQDRDAIRALMAAQADRKPEAPRASPKTKKKPPKKKAGKKRPDFWWRESVDVDPISLEPLSDLEYAPFELGPHLFDGRVLAFYVVSTGTFLNPMSRDALGLEDCVALDDYLGAHGLDEARVADAFRLSQLLAKDGDAGTDSAQSSAARNQRRQATAVLHNLFGFARYGDSLAAGRGGRGARDGASPGGNLRSAFDERDSDDERRGTAGGHRLVDDGDVGGDATASEDEDAGLQAEAFPTLGGGPAARAIDQGSGWQAAARGGGGVLNAGALQAEDFPTLGGAPARRARPAAAPRFRDAVQPYRIDMSSGGGAAAAQRARAVAAAPRAAPPPPTREEQYPALPSNPSHKAALIAQQYRALAQVSRPAAAAESGSAVREAGLSKRERERLRRREREKEAKRDMPATGGSVVARIREAAGDEALAELRERSLEFRRGELGAAALYDSAAALLPADRFLELFGGLVAVIPDVDARRVLEALIAERHVTASGAAAARRAPPPPPGLRGVPTPVRPTQPPPYAPPPAPPPPPPATAPPKKADFPTLRADPPKPAAAKPKPRRAPAAGGWSSALSKAAGGGTKARAKTGLSIAAPRRAQPSPALAARDADFSAPPADRGAAPKPKDSGPPGFKRN